MPLLSCLPVHDFGPFGAGLNVTVEAGLITQFTHIDLHSVDAGSSQMDACLMEAFREWEYRHEELSFSVVSNTSLAHNRRLRLSSSGIPPLLSPVDYVQYHESNRTV